MRKTVAIYLRHSTLTLAVIGGLAHAIWPAASQQPDYPSRPVRVVVSVAPGGGVDSITRFIADKLHQPWGQPVTVENRTGGGGNIAAEQVAGSAPDGYTLMASPPAPLSINLALYKKLSYDPAAFESVAILGLTPNVLVVRADFPAKTVQEFVAYAKANAGKLNYASQGNGSTAHLTAEMLALKMGVKLVHVPYKGAGPAINDLIAGHVDMMFSDVAPVLALHASGRVRIIAAAVAQRIGAIPDIPTLSESVLPGFESATWHAWTAPPKTPVAVTGKINATINEILKQSETQAHYRNINLQAVEWTPPQMTEFLAKETRRWSEVIEAANIKME
jgi:tripartite-type tricarboxylate transporter receptor subunit TctC